MPHVVKPKIALIWVQFAAYHVDRCEAVAKRLGERADVLAVEVVSSSDDYAWEVSGDVAGARKITLFPGKSLKDVAWPLRLKEEFRILRDCQMVFSGIPYSMPDMILLAWLLKLVGVKVVMPGESKFDDFPRSRLRERLKSMVTSAYFAAIVGGKRGAEYAQHLGFRRRTVLPGYDCVGLDRIRGQGGPPAPAGPRFEDRPYIFVGRFVEKKNPEVLLQAYARYVAIAGPRVRRLVMAGDGPLGRRLHELAENLAISHLVYFPGFLTAREVASQLSQSLALVLVSLIEQWGLVVNEALAFSLPAIVSSPVGARDALVRDGVNGFVVDPGSVEEIAQAMASLAGDEALWIRMVEASRTRAWMGDTERLADAVELLLYPSTQDARARVAAFEAEMEVAVG